MIVTDLVGRVKMRSKSSNSLYCTVYVYHWLFLFLICSVMITVTESRAIPHTQDRRQERLTVTFIPSPPITTNETAIFNCASKPPVAAFRITWWLKDPHTGIERGPTQREEFTSAGIITTGSWTGNSSLIIPGHLTQFNNTLIVCYVTPQLIALPQEIRIAPLIILKVRLVAILFIPSPPITKVGKAIYNCSSSVSSITIQWFMGNNETPTHNNNSLISAGVVTNGAATTNSSLIIPGYLTQFNNTLIHCLAGGSIGGATVNEVHSAPLYNNN